MKLFPSPKLGEDGIKQMQIQVHFTGLLSFTCTDEYSVL